MLMCSSSARPRPRLFRCWRRVRGWSLVRPCSREERGAQMCSWRVCRTCRRPAVGAHVPVHPTVRQIYGYVDQSLLDDMDWTTKGAGTPMKNQSQCESYWIPLKMPGGSPPATCHLCVSSSSRAAARWVRLTKMGSWTAASIPSRRMPGAWRPVKSTPQLKDVRTTRPQYSSVSQHVQDQSSGGSCWIFRSTEAFNDRRCITPGDTTLMSVEETTANCGFSSCFSMACNGGQSGQTWLWQKNTGVVTGSDRRQPRNTRLAAPASHLSWYVHRRRSEKRPHVSKKTCGRGGAFFATSFASSLFALVSSRTSFST